MKLLATPMLSMALLLTMPAFVSAQVFNGNLTLSTQAEVDAFNYTEVTGDLIIGYADGPPLSDINNLQSLSSLTKVRASLIIRNNNQLQDLQGLENLTTISELIIAGNTSLSSLKALSSLVSLGVLHIFNIDQLQDLQGLENVTDLYTLIIEDNASITALQHLGSVRSNCDMIIIQNNDQLQDLQGLENVSSAGYIEISRNEQLQDIKALENLSRVSFLQIISNGQLQSLQGLEKITSISAGLIIHNNNQLVDLHGLNNLTGIGFTSNTNNAQGQELQRLTRSSEMDKQSEQEEEEMRPTFWTEDDEFYGLFISNNDLLKNLKGLDNFTTIEVYFADVRIAYNASLTSLEGLENLTSVRLLSEGSDFMIVGNSSLTSLQGLNNLTRINESFHIRDNPALISLQGLDNFTSVGEGFYIDNNDQLKNLKGLESFTSATDFSITNNDQLENLEGLENVSSLSVLDIVDNPVLNDCCAIARLVARGNYRRISGNGSNCDSGEAIRESCPPVITDFTLVNAVTDQDILDLDERSAPKVINVLETGTALNFRANTVGGVGSVVFELDGAIIRKENVAPYALFGDEPAGDYRAGMLTQGRHTITATPYTGKNGKGKAGFPLTVEFIIVDKESAVINFFLVNTKTNLYLDELKEGSIISLEQVDNTKLNIEANTFPGTVGSVVFDLNEVKNFRTENTWPYALAGDDPARDYKDYTFTPGTYHLTATPYSMPKGRGKAGNPLSITFEVGEEDQMMLARTMPVISPKSKEVGEPAAGFKDLSVTQDAAQVWVYPNPSNEVLQVQVAGLRDSQSSIKLILYSSLGKKVWEGTAAANQTAHIAVNHLPGGVYLLKAVGNGHAYIRRILVK